jgi:DNA helicase-2/ATP-dependent DNA helicase PcrA
MIETDKQAIDKLNDAQKQAVEILNGPVLVVAGAGTGKTRVIVERIQHLISQGTNPAAILALTFTEKAANEMLDRVNAGKIGVTIDTTIATFNRFGNDLLEKYGSEWGLGRLRLLGGTGQLVFLREHLDNFELDYFAPVSNPDGQLELLAKYASLLKQQLVTPKQLKGYADGLPNNDDAEKLDKQKHTELARFYTKYLELCRLQQVIDYDDQLYLTIEILRNRPNILKEIQQQYQYILVDEFQDTNPMQSELVDLLAGKNKNIMVVGDDDQSIYGWRGATLANILDFKQRYPDAMEVTLIENYRSTQDILDTAYRLIQHNNPHRLEVMHKLDKRLHGQAKGPAPELLHFSTYEAELAWLAENIQDRLKMGADAGSIAVITRRNHGVRRIHQALELYGVPHKVAGLRNDIYAQHSVRQLIEALKAVADPLNDLALFHTLSGPLFELGSHQLASLSSQANRQHKSLSEMILMSEDASYTAALSLIDSWRTLANEQGVGSLAYTLLTDSGWKQRLYTQASEEPTAVTSEIQAISKFFITLKEFERITGVASVQNYILNLPILQAAGSQFDDPSLDIVPDQVNVLSVHGSKGLEWDTVYLVDCTEGSFPLYSRGNNLSVPVELLASPSEADDHIAEERRLMYVAATRAGKELVISYADRHGNGAHRKPSRFLGELLGSEPSGEALEETTQTSLELFNSPNPTDASVSLPDRMMKDGQLSLSVSEIEVWLRCPKDFYYRYVLGMPLPPAPQLDYGSLIHRVIEQIHIGRQQGKVPSLKQLTADVVKNMPQTGYASKRSRDRAHAQAPLTVKAVYERFLNDDLPIETEWPFELVLPDLALLVRGKIDAVYQTGKGVEIRDFKTGNSVRTEEQAKSRVSGSQQLTLYALAWQMLRDELPAKLTLDFVETGQSYGIKKQAKSLETMSLKLAQMVKDLRSGNYPDGRDHSYCMHPVSD